MKIVLRRTVNVRWALVQGKVAFAERRVAEHAVVVWAAERLREGLETRAEQLCEATAQGPLLGLPPVVGRRLSRVCEELGLLHLDKERIVRLTPEGERVAASAEPRVFVPQLGAWWVFWAEDPLLTQPLLRVEPGKEPSAHKERQARNGERREVRRQFHNLPDTIAALCDERGERPPLELPAARDGRPVRMVALERKVELLRSEDRLMVELTFEPDATEGLLRLRGRVGDSGIDATLPLLRGLDHATAWRTLLRLKGAEDWWNPRSGKLQMPFNGLRDEARESFRHQMSFRTPEIDRLGRFDDTVVDGVPIEPATLGDAQRWFEWLLERRADRTQWPDVFMANAMDVTQLFPDHSVRVPAQSDLARQVRGAERPRAAYWHLQAPLDLDGGAS
ncbi:hypothetical protein BE20_13475 [Sorangium cellulosum]|uniref:Uncharacterized protein n=1 Tax=Sorangium cellulosum TaxID=56 RepID=A0A150SM59_SORCE|nr:hypothetical protein BE20_13475 [Sorangium cellulosum]KYF93519.1 hypothetical protein BE18_30525 [Sorangium cellulosum]